MKTLLIVVCLIVLVGCSGEKKRIITSDATDSIMEETPTEVPKKTSDRVQLVSYSVMKEIVNDARTTTSVNVLLSKEVSEMVLTDIARALRTERQQYQRVLIYYNLQGKAPGDSPWATTHFTPELELKIIGSSLDKAIKQSTAAVPKR